MHYVKIPPTPIHLVDDLTDQPLAAEPTMEVSHALRVLFRDARINEALTAPEVYDLRSRLLTAKSGDVVQLSKEEHAALVPLFEKPRVFGSPFLYSPEGQAFIESFLKAPTKAPVEPPPAVP
jgi:hypothetical protein